MESKTIKVQGALQSECGMNNNISESQSKVPEPWHTRMFDIGVIGIIEPDEGVGNSNSPSPIRSPTQPSLSSSQEKCDSPDSVFLHDYKRSRRCDEASTPLSIDPCKEDMFDRLSDEIIVEIFSKVSKHMLATLSLVCKRFRRLCLDECLWPRFDLSFQTLPPCTLGYVLARGVRALRLNTSAVTFPVFNPSLQFKPGFMFKVEYLDLSAVHIFVKDLERLLSKCNNLKKLSVEACELSDEICYHICQNSKLDTLDMAMCTGLSAQGLKAIASSCQRLENVNISWCNLSREAIAGFCRDVSPCLVSLNLAGSLQSLSNEDVETLVKRCPELIEMDISDCAKITGQVIDCLLNGVDNLQKLSISRSYKIGAANILQLKCKASLYVLNIFGNYKGNMFPSHMMKYLKSVLPGVSINVDMMSPIARPTVGIRRTSIWEIRCRE